MKISSLAWVITLTASITSCQNERNVFVQTNVVTQAVVGDGVIDGAEVCDDANINNGDGCDDAGQVEPGFTCDGLSPTTCVVGVTEFCTNGVDDDADGLVDVWDSDCPCTDEGPINVCPPTCTYTPAAQPYSPQVIWESVVVDGRETALVGDMDNDGVPEVVVDDYGNPGTIYILNGQTGAIEHSIATGLRLDQNNSSNAIADVDRDGFGEVYFVDRSARLSRAVFDSSLNTWVMDYTSTSLVDNRLFTPGLADFDGDGVAEVHVGNQIFDAATGTLLLDAPTADSDPGGSVAIDILPDSACANCAGLELVTNRRVWSVDLATPTITQEVLLTSAGTGRGPTSVADVDDDGDLDVVFTTAFDSGSGNKAHVVIWDGQSDALLMNPFEVPAGTNNVTTTVAGRVNIADFDDDGKLEFGFAGRRIYVVVDDVDEAAANAGAGQVMWSLFNSDNSARTGSTVFDFEADGKAEVVYRDQTDLYVFEGATGNVLFQSDCNSGTRWEYPVVADVNADGATEVIVTCSAASQGVSVFSSSNAPWAPSRSVWNQHAYNVTNIFDNLMVPAIPGDNVNAYGGVFNNFLVQASFVDAGGGAQFPVPDAEITAIAATYLSCDDQIEVTYTVENTGDANIPANFPVSFYDADPVTSAANLLGTLTTNAIIAPGDDDTFSGTLTALGPLTIFAVVNDPGTTTPFDPESDFPVTQTGECDFSNNVTTFTIPVCPKCGNNITEAVNGETCDDGNNTPGDGCDENCLLECVITTGSADREYNRNVSAANNAIGVPDGALAVLSTNDFLVLDMSDVLVVGASFALTLSGGAGASAEICFSLDNATYSNCSTYTPSVANLIETIQPLINGETRFVRIEHNAGTIRVDGLEYKNEYCFECGNGVIDPETNCDDGNLLPGDGCDETCNLEPGCVWQVGFGDTLVQRNVASPNDALGGNDAFVASLSLSDELVIDLTDTLPAAAELQIVYETNGATDAASISFSSDGINYSATQAMPLGTSLGNQETLSIVPAMPTRFVRFRGLGGTYRIDSVNYAGNVFCNVCGDGIIAGGEVCDDGNTIDGDGCDAECALESGCSILSGSAQSEYSQGVSAPASIVGAADNLASVTNATDQQVVDLGVVLNSGEDIALRLAATNPTDTIEIYLSDDGIDYSATPINFAAGTFNVSTNYGYVTLTLTQNTRFLKFESTGATVRFDSVEYVNAIYCEACGNGVLDAGEACDDANNTPGDGCSATCTFEPGCSALGSVSLSATQVGVASPQNFEGVPDGERATLSTGAHALFDFGDVFSAGTVIHVEASGENAGTSQFAISCSEEGVNYSPLAVFSNPNPINAFKDIEVTCPIDARFVRLHRLSGRTFLDALTIERSAECDACGNGHIEAGEACDDGNLTSSDGCDENCILEDGCSVLSNFGTSLTHVGIASPNNSLGSPDSSLAVLSGTNDLLNITLAQPVPAGTDIVVALSMSSTAQVSVKFSDGEGCDVPAAEQILTGSLDSSANSVEYITLTAPFDTSMLTLQPLTGIGRVDMVGVADQIRCSVCGDGMTDPGETCDDGDSDDGDGCDSNCAVEVGSTCDTCHASFCVLPLTYASISGVYDIAGRATLVTEAEIGTKRLEVFVEVDEGERRRVAEFDVLQMHPSGHAYDLEALRAGARYYVVEHDFQNRRTQAGPFEISQAPLEKTKVKVAEKAPQPSLAFAERNRELLRFEARGVGLFVVDTALLAQHFSLSESEVEAKLSAHEMKLMQEGEEVVWVAQEQGLVFAQTKRRDPRYWPAYQLALLRGTEGQVIDEASVDTRAALLNQKFVLEEQRFPPLVSSPNLDEGADLFYTSTLASFVPQYQKLSLGEVNAEIREELRCWFLGAASELSNYRYTLLIDGAPYDEVLKAGEGLHELSFDLRGVNVDSVEIELSSTGEGEMISHFDRCETWVSQSDGQSTLKVFDGGTFDAADGAVVLVEREGEIFVFREGELIAGDKVYQNEPQSVSALRSLYGNDAVVADLVIIAPLALMPAAHRLAEEKNENAIETQVLSLEGIFDETRFSQRDPRALNAFIDTLKEHVSVLVMGAGHLDYLNDSDPSPNLVPPQTTLDDNGLRPQSPQHARYGILPARTIDEAYKMVDALVGYDALESYNLSRALIVDEDSAGTIDFEVQSAALYESLSGLGETELYLYRESDQTRDEETLEFMRSKNWVNYVGHSGLVGWSQQTWIGAESLEQGTKVPLMTGWTCLWNHFAFPNVDSFGEVALRKQSALSVYAPMTVVPHNINESMSLMFADASRRANNLGDVLAQLPLDERSYFVLLGDPTMPLPFARIEAASSTNPNLSAGAEHFIAHEGLNLEGPSEQESESDSDALPRRGASCRSSAGALPSALLVGLLFVRRRRQGLSKSRGNHG